VSVIGASPRALITDRDPVATATKELAAGAVVAHAFGWQMITDSAAGGRLTSDSSRPAKSGRQMSATASRG
jgi:hypothetical protein